MNQSIASDNNLRDPISEKMDREYFKALSKPSTCKSIEDADTCPRCKALENWSKKYER